ncbi:hypothetical protein D3C71_1160700 [compost metagenome]
MPNHRNITSEERIAERRFAHPRLSEDADLKPDIHKALDRLSELFNLILAQRGLDAFDSFHGLEEVTFLALAHVHCVVRHTLLFLSCRDVVLAEELGHLAVQALQNVLQGRKTSRHWLESNLHFSDAQVMESDTPACLRQLQPPWFSLGRALLGSWRRSYAPSGPQLRGPSRYGEFGSAECAPRTDQVAGA